jgi:hypothetical protein
MSTGNVRATRQATLKLLDSEFKVAKEVQIWISQGVRGKQLNKEQKINFQNCFTDARSEDAWIAMNYMIRLIKENQK